MLITRYSLFLVDVSLCSSRDIKSDQIGRKKTRVDKAIVDFDASAMARQAMQLVTEEQLTPNNK